MKLKAFIGWSGDLSCRLASEINKWLPNVLQNVKTFYSEEDIDKGAKWDSEISKELDESQVGIICLTQENRDERWILFEAGALSAKMGKPKVCPILFGFKPEELKPPLATFQLTRFTKEEFKKLIISINSSLAEEGLKQAALDETFAVWWPRLESKVKDIMESYKPGTKKEARPEKDILVEILETVRMLAKNQKPVDAPNQLLPGTSPTFALGAENMKALREAIGKWWESSKVEDNTIKMAAAMSAIDWRKLGAHPSVKPMPKTEKPEEKK